MSNFEKEIRKFLDQMCSDGGFCLPPDDVKRLMTWSYYDADQFVREIFKAEGLDPDLELHLFRRWKKQFTDKYGSRLG